MLRTTIPIFVLSLSCAMAACAENRDRDRSDARTAVDASDLFDSGTVLDAGSMDTGAVDSGAPDTGVPDTGQVPFEVVSSAFTEGGTVPLRHECGPPLQGPGSNISPDLTWTPGPTGTQSYAIVVRDVDAQIPQFPEGIIHWVIYDIPVDVMSLAEGLPDGYQVTDPAGAKQANIQNSGFFGYFGPCSPNSVNTYVWTLHAMSTATVPNVTMASSESEIAAEIESTSIDRTSLSGES